MVHFGIKHTYPNRYQRKPTHDNVFISRQI